MMDSASYLFAALRSRTSLQSRLNNASCESDACSGGVYRWSSSTDSTCPCAMSPPYGNDTMEWRYLDDQMCPAKDLSNMLGWTRGRAHPLLACFLLLWIFGLTHRWSRTTVHQSILKLLGCAASIAAASHASSVANSVLPQAVEQQLTCKLQQASWDAAGLFNHQTIRR